MKKLFLFFLLLQLSLWADNHKIVYMLSGPRSLSTVFLRIIESRGDFTIYHEPTLPIYDKVHLPEMTADWFHEDSYTTFEDVKENIFQSAKSSHVFIKDMASSSQESLLNDPAFMEDPAVHFVFLVRNPHAIAISLYRKLDQIYYPEMNSWMALKALYEEYEAIRKVNPNGVKILFSEQLYQTPELALTAFCNALDIPYLDDMFNWEKKDEGFQGEAKWHEQKVGNQIHYWHERALQSTHLASPQIYETDAMGQPTFSEISDENDREKLKEAYLENLIYYEKFMQAEDNHLIPLSLMKKAEALPHVGTLKQTPEGLAYVDLDDRYIHELVCGGFEKPPYFEEGLIGAHITAIYADEEIELTQELGTDIPFTLGEFQVIHPPHFPNVSEALLITVHAPALELLRKKHGLPPLPFPFHITIGVKSTLLDHPHST